MATSGYSCRARSSEAEGAGTGREEEDDDELVSVEMEEDDLEDRKSVDEHSTNGDGDKLLRSFDDHLSQSLTALAPKTQGKQVISLSFGHSLLTSFPLQLRSRSSCGRECRRSLGVAAVLLTRCGGAAGVSLCAGWYRLHRSAA